MCDAWNKCLLSSPQLLITELEKKGKILSTDEKNEIMMVSSDFLFP